ncbi:MAG: TonB-dependent receptor plug domain-containing protein [Chlorobi bacterium]|nr:TonB-dependent receptor plug domain-containing protein [Chlorobiota bacterium]MCI0715666.1 TonB-dependent receptor plug domain-containing protein [Chlorobiota bacterium]
MLKLFSISIFFFISNIFAQENISSGKDSVLIDEILVESNRLKMTRMLAPNKIEIIDEKTISNINGSKLSDALEITSSLFVKDYGFNSGLKTIALNLTQSEQTLVLLDGVKLNNKQHEQVDLAMFNLDEIDRIEISEGGSSSLYGSEAIGGVINIFTKRNSFNRPFSFQLKSGLGSYDFKKFFAKFSHNLMKNGNNFINYRLSFSDERAENNYEYHFFNGFNEVLKQREKSDYNTQSLNFDFNIFLNRETDLRVITYYGHFNRGLPGIELGYTPSSARQIDYNLMSSASISRVLNNNWYLNVSFDYQYSLMKYFDPATYSLSIPINSFYKLFSHINRSNFSYLPLKKFGFDFGYEAGYYTIKSNDTEEGDLFQAGIYTAGKYEVRDAVFSKVTVYPAVRYDYYSNIESKNVFTGKLGINIKPACKVDLTFKSTLGNNFRSPTFNMLYWKELGIKNLKPERSVNFDAGLYFRFNLIAANTVEVSYHNITTTQRLLWKPGIDGIWRPANIGKVLSEGIDAGIKSSISLFGKVSLTLGFSYNYGTAKKKNEDFPDDPSYNKQLIYIPKEMFKSQFMFNYLTSSNVIKYVSFNVFYNFTGKRYVNFENTIFTPYYERIDVNIATGFIVFDGELSLKFLMNNLFNEDYQVVSGYPMPLRNYKLELSYKY